MKLFKTCNYIIKICLLVIIFLVPIFFQCYTYRCWELNTSILFQILVEVATFFWLIKIIFYRSPNQFSLKIILPVVSLFLFLVLATIFSEAPQYSFLGSYDRKMGLITWLHGLLLFLLIISEVRSWDLIKKFLIVIILDVTMVCLYGFAQLTGLSISFSNNPLHFFLDLQWNTPAVVSIFETRIFSTFGQPNFLASWLLLVFPVLMFCSFYVKKFYLRSLLIILNIILLLLLVLTQSRGAWLAFVAEIILFILVWLYLRGNKKALIIFIVFISVLIIAYCYLNILPLKIETPSSSLIYRIESTIFLKKSVTAHTRWISWQTAWELIKQRPILGYGPEIFGLKTMQYYKPINAVYEMINTYPDRAHNDLLDMLLIAGAFGLIAYLFFLLIIFYYGFKRAGLLVRKKSIAGWLLLSLLMGLFGYLFSLQFSFHDIQTFIYFWVYLGLISVFIFCSVDLNPTELKVLPKTKFNLLKILISIILLAVFILFIWQFSFKTFLADLYYKKARLAFLGNQVAEGLFYYEKVIGLKPEEVSYRENFAHDCFTMANFIPDKEAKDKLRFLTLAIDNINDIPKSSRVYTTNLFLVRMMSMRANVSRLSEDFTATDKVFYDLADSYPELAMIYNEWCQFKIYQKNWLVAREKCLRALSLYPDFNNPALVPRQKKGIINEMRQVYDKIAQIYLVENNYTEALKTYWTILRLDPFQYQYYKKIADIYYLKHDFDSAIKYNLHGYVLSPKDYNWPLAIALLYYEKGDYKMAKDFANQAQKLNSDDHISKQILQQLK